MAGCREWDRMLIVRMFSEACGIIFWGALKGQEYGKGLREIVTARTKCESNPLCRLQLSKILS